MHVLSAMHECYIEKYCGTTKNNREEFSLSDNVIHLHQHVGCIISHFTKTPSSSPYPSRFKQRKIGIYERSVTLTASKIHTYTPLPSDVAETHIGTRRVYLSPPQERTNQRSLVIGTLKRAVFPFRCTPAPTKSRVLRPRRSANAMAGRALLAAFGALLLLSICHAETENDTCNADQPESCAAKPAATSRFSWLTKLSLGANSVPIRYMLDMSILQKPGASWLNIFCDGQARGCTRKLDWPGPQTYSQIGWETVRELGSQMPRNEWSGKWWRGNELGTVINNPFYYYSEDSTNRSRLSPLAIALGISPKQHAAIRPIFNRAFDIRGDNFEKAKEYVMKTAKELLEKRTAEGTLTHTDLKVWFHKVVNKITFDREVDDEYCLRFTTVQGKFLSTQLLSQLLPKRMYGVDPMKMTQTRKDVIEYVDEYKTLLQEQYADLLEGQDCSPSVSCVDQAAFGVFDAFVAAGGVSVPGTILQCEFRGRCLIAYARTRFMLTFYAQRSLLSFQLILPTPPASR